MKFTVAALFGLGVVGTLGPKISAPTPATLGIQGYAGLTITGAVGKVYAIEYVADRAQTNDPSGWAD